MPEEMRHLENTRQDWAYELYLKELCQTFRATWEAYLKFYTVFLTVNMVAVGVVMEVRDAETTLAVIVIIFLIQNLVSLGTALGIVWYSRNVSREVRQHFYAIAPSLAVKASVNSPLPGPLTIWGGTANAIGQLALIGAWLYLGIAYGW